MRKELEQIAEQARQLEASELPRFLGELREVEVIALARIASPAAASDEAMLDAKTAADRLGIKLRTFYNRHKARYASFTHHEGSKLVADPKGLARYLAAKRRR
jgi:hypothetical protein